MKRIFRAAGLAVCLAAVAWMHAAGAEVISLGDFRLLGGQYYFNANPSALSGNLSLTVVPAVKFSDSFSLVPTYLGSYRGTKEVNDLAGGGTLFQDAQEHLVSLKGIIAATPVLKLKLGGSYRLEFLRETKDETWGKGLFDYQKLNVGAEVEYAFARRHSVRLGVDSFSLAFPNYESLESSVTAGGLGRELAGKNTLNSANVMGKVTLTDTFGRLRTEGSFGLIAKAYPDQPVILADDSLSKEKRNDTFSFASLALTHPFALSPAVKMLATLRGNFFSNDSTQGHYDARKTFFTPDYYDYARLQIAPNIDFLLGSAPCVVTLGASFGRQNYTERLAQDSGGNYLAEKIAVDEIIYSVGATYPLGRQFRLRLAGSVITASSNMNYESTFAYNYQTANYLFGFSYEF